MNKFLTLAAAGFALGIPVMAQQASITLQNSDVAFCYKQEQPWKVSKTNDALNQPVPSPTTVNWTITATPQQPGPKQLCAMGIVTILNSGSANATIGNIIVDLQRGNSGANKWKAVAVDVADALHGGHGNGGTAKAVAGALANQTDYTPVAVIANPAAIFGENQASGELEFTDASNNSAFSITPAPVIAPGASVTLFFNARFNADKILPALVPGEQIRAEVLVTFGNSGARGGSGASAQNIDINGSNSINAEEANVRTVPTRITNPLPPLQICNQSVTITDSFSTTGSAQVSSISGDDPGAGTVISALNGTRTFLLSGSVSGSGLVTNTVTLDGTDSAPTTLLLGTYTFPTLCCTAVHLTDTSSVYVGAVTPAPTYCSYSRNEYLHNGDGNPLLVAGFNGMFVSALYGVNTKSGLLVGNQGGNFHAGWDNETKFEDWLGGGGSNGALTANTFNATSTDGGKLPKNAAALLLNVKLGIANGIGELVYHETGHPYDNMKVKDILTAVQAIVGGGPLPGGYTYNDIDGLVDHLNQSWNKCKPNALVRQGSLY